MNTLRTTSARIAANVLNNGGVVAFPTETVYGLGASVFDEMAIKKVFEAKGRPSDNPLIVHVESIEKIRLIASEIPSNAKKFIDAFFPGPLTIVLPKNEKVSLIATGGLETVGVRMPRNKLAQQLLIQCETPVVAPSANLSGKPSPTTWEAVLEDLDGKIDCILEGEVSEIGLESTVVDCTEDIPILLRAGAVSLEELRKVVPETKRHKTGGSQKTKSPGLKHKHYSPKATVEIISELNFNDKDLEHAAFIGGSIPSNRFRIVKICNSVEVYAHSVFEFFRECDRKNIDTIYCESVEEKGIGTALMDRLRRASES